MIYGYARVSTDDQNHECQIDDLVSDGIPADRIVAEKVPVWVMAKARPGLSGLFDRLTEGDTLTVTKLDKLGRDAPDTSGLIRDLQKRGIGVRILSLGACTSGPAVADLTLGFLDSVAEWEAPSSTNTQGEVPSSTNTQKKVWLLLVFVAGLAVGIMSCRRQPVRKL